MAFLVGVSSVFFIMKTQTISGFKPVPASQLDHHLKSQYPEFYKTIANNKGTLTANNLIGVPGLGGARSVGQAKQWQYTTNMTPQSLIESGAKAYRKKTPIIIDRILQTDISNFDFK